jgi:glutamate N-acetyltransferase / amino-acid N-acetyltransferase
VSIAGAPATFFRSRWVERPDGVRELDPDELPAGFRAAGVACGIKASGDLDLGIVVCDSEEAVSAARFTRNAVVAAPVTISRGAELTELRAVVANSGNANVAGGEQGMAVAEAMVRTSARGLGLGADRVAVASTGVIGAPLEMSVVLEGVTAGLAALAPRAGEFARSILTTDQGPKYVTVEVALSRGPVRLSAQAKGAGMISPSFATLLCFVETDARVDRASLGRFLDSGVERSFERISVDGQLSTNDSVFMIAGGGSGIEVVPGTDDEQAFARALDAVLKQLALEMVADGEGATRVARLRVRGSGGGAEPVARSIANSPLVKCALYGGDPNWGRVLQAAGQALLDAGGATLDLWIEGVQVARENVALPLAEPDRKRVEDAIAREEVELRLDFADGQEEAEVYFSDLGHDYVDLNSRYSS